MFFSLQKTITFDEIGTKRKQYRWHGIPVLLKERAVDCSRTRLLGITISCHRHKNVRIADKKFFTIFTKHSNNVANKTFIVFDHSLGGGTERYFENKLAKLKRKNCIIRIQYFYENKHFLITTFYKNDYYTYVAKNLEIVAEILHSLKPHRIIVNNLVGYRNIPQVLRLIKELKTKNITVGMRGHDYQAICPFFTLINNDGYYCGVPNITACKNCFEKNYFIGVSNEYQEILKSGATDVISWRAMWGDFFENVLDEMIVFSASGRDIFLRAYPCLENKIKIIPHETQRLPKVCLRRHDKITIGILGGISSAAKGEKILAQMYPLCKGRGVNMVMIGWGNNKNIPCTGKYDTKKLPDIIKKEKVDIIFIPSIWPETFSYTTSEAISMGMPVACFDLGAPAERVKNYEHGLVIDKIDAQYALDKITKFLTKKDK